MDAENSTMLTGAESFLEVSDDQGNVTVAVSELLNDRDKLIVHSLALVSLTISIIVSISTMSYILLSGPKIKFWKRKIAERLVVYLAVTDLLFSITHCMDHVYFLIHWRLPPRAYCISIAFIIQEVLLAQTIIIMFTAVNAFFLIVRERTLSTGRYDWRLLFTSVAVPGAFESFMASCDLLGEAEIWCLVNKESEWAWITNFALSAFFILIFFTDASFYTLVLLKIRRVTKNLENMAEESSASKGRKTKNINSARIMSVFVLAFIMQWFGYVIYSLWSFLAPPPLALLCVTVLSTDMGGVFNCLAYTVVRKISLNQKDGTIKKRPTVARSSDDKKF